MGIGSVMRTSVSGMNAQANRLSAVSENIANSNTTGYKRATTEFSSMVLPSTQNEFNSGVVTAQTRNLISQQGGLSYTTNSSSSQAIDLAVSGKGFFIVGDGDGGTFLTRAGSFVKNGAGDLVNAAGFKLQGYPLPEGDTNGVSNGFAGLVNVNLNAATLRLKPTDKGLLTVNLDKAAPIVVGTATVPAPASGVEVVGNTPDTFTGAAGEKLQYTSKESIVVYDNTGKEVILDVYMTKKAHAAPAAGGGAATNDTWEYTIFDRSEGAKTGADVPFPYSPAGQLGTTTVKFDANGQLIEPAVGSIDINIPNGRTMKLSLSGTTQLNATYQTLASSVNGNPPENVDQVSVSENGIITAKFKSGTEIPLFKVPLALVESPDNMTTVSGNVFNAGLESGTVLVGFGGESGLGKLISGALENSTVDLAGELTTMIESQRSYTANSKVFQTGSEILDVLVNLKR